MDYDRYEHLIRANKRGKPVSQEMQTRWTIERTSTETNDLLTSLLKHAVEADRRETSMLWWTVAGVVLAGIAAAASIAALALAA